MQATDKSHIKQDVMSSLVELPYICNFSVQDLARISPYVQEKTIPAGDALFQQGDTAATLYYLLEGEIEVVSESSKKVIHTGFVGEESVLHQPKYFYHATTKSACKLLVFHASKLVEFLDQYSSIKHEFSLSLLRFGIDDKDVINIVPDKKTKASEGKAETKKFYGWILSFLIPITIYNLPILADLAVNTKIFISIFATTINVWVFKLVPDYVAGLLPIIVVLVLGITPSSVILSGFQSSSFFMAMSIFVLSAIVVQSGLFYRILLVLMKYIPPIKFLYNFMLMMIGMVLSSIIPSTNGRVSMTAPLLTDIINILSFKKKGKEANRLALSTFFGVSIFSATFITSKSINFVVFGMLPIQVQEGFQWLNWAMAASVSALVSLVIFLIISMFVYRSDEKVNFNRLNIEKQLKILGPISYIEWGIILGILILITGIVTTSLHKIKPAWIAMGLMFVFLAWNTMDKQGFKNKIDWPFLFLLGSLIGLAKTISFLEIDDMIAMQLGGLIGLMRDNFYLFVLALTAIIFVIRFALSTNAAVVLVASIFLPLSESAGINAWVMGFMILTLSEAFLVPYQCTYYVMLKNFNEQYQIYDEASFLKFNILGSFIRIIAIYASIPVWQSMGILQQ